MTEGVPLSDELAIAAKAADELAPHVQQFARSVGLLDPAREIVGSWTDRLQIRRELRRAEALMSAADKVRRLDLPTTIIRDRLLAEVLEGAADEDNPQLSDAWSSLLANAATGAPIAPGFPSVLRQLEPIEARLLDAGAQRQGGVKRVPDIHLDQLHGVEQVEWRHLDNVERLGLIVYEVDLPQNIELPEHPTGVTFGVTPFGDAFVRACSGPE